MDDASLKDLLLALRSGEVDIDHALGELRRLPFSDLGVAKVDHHRAIRQGVPEVILGERKTRDEIARISRALLDAGQNVLVTRLDAAVAADLVRDLPELTYNARARTGRITLVPPATRRGPIAVVTAGTSDVGVAEEACETLDALGVDVERLYDAGVAGIHRLFSSADLLARARAIIAIAGMEGALPSVIGGLVRCPVIAVPTSVGYGTALGGMTALLAMLTSCANGIVVVNIDSGFGAAMAVHRLLAVPPPDR